MMKKKHSLLAGLLLSALLLTALVSCGGGPDAKETQVPADTASNGAAVSGTEAAETATQRYRADIPEDLDYDGYAFRMLMRSDNLDTRVYCNFDFESESGDALQDGIYARNLHVEEMLNVGISQIPAEKPGNTAKTAILAGDNAFDAILTLQTEQYSLTTAGALLNLYGVPYIDLTASWWDQDLRRELTVFDKLYYTTGEITVLDDIVRACAGRRLDARQGDRSCLWRKPGPQRRRRDG